MYFAGAGAAASPDATYTLFGAVTEKFAPSNLENAGGLTLNLAGAANCAVPRPETVQHGSDAQFDAATAEFDEVPQDELLERIAESPDMPRIEPPLERGQQSAEELTAPQILWVHVVAAMAG